MLLCFLEPNCVSCNFKILRSENGEHKCELNNSTHEGHESELEENTDYAYHGAQVRNAVDRRSKFYPIGLARLERSTLCTCTTCRLVEVCFPLVSLSK